MGIRGGASVAGARVVERGDTSSDVVVPSLAQQPPENVAPTQAVHAPPQAVHPAVHPQPPTPPLAFAFDPFRTTAPQPAGGSVVTGGVPPPVAPDDGSGWLASHTMWDDTPPVVQSVGATTPVVVEPATTDDDDDEQNPVTPTTTVDDASAATPTYPLVVAAPTPAPAVEAATPFNPFDTAGAVDAGIPVVQAIDEVFGGGAGAAGAGAGAAGAGAGAAAASTVGNEASARYWESVTIPLSEIHILEKIGAGGFAEVFKAECVQPPCARLDAAAGLQVVLCTGTVVPKLRSRGFSTSPMPLVNRPCRRFARK